MQVGGTEIDTRFTYLLSANLAASFALVWFFLSFYTAVLLLTAFCFGAGILSFILDFSNKNEVPNILSRWSRPSKNLLSRQKKIQTNEVQIPVEIDQALERLYERILQEHIYPWYSLVSYDDDFVQEIRFIFRHATLEITRRLSCIDLTSLIVRKAIPIGLTHLDSMMKSVEYREKFAITSEESHTVLFEYFGPSVHPSSLSRLREVEYCRAIASNLVSMLMPKKYQTSRSLVLLATDILQGAVLQPVLDLLPDPDRCINYLIAEAFHPGPSRKFPEPSGKCVSMLENFVSNHESRQSIIFKNERRKALKMDFSDILNDQGSLFSFMKFLREENSLNPLQFCLSAEHFNKRILTPELSEDEMKALHKDALELYDLYLKPNAKHKIDVDDCLGEEIFSILNGPVSDVVLLRTTTPLFKAYEKVFRQLENVACPAFHKSEEYFVKLLHGREGEMQDSMERISERYFKNWLISLKRLPLIRTTRAPHSKSIFYARLSHEEGIDKEKEKSTPSLLKVPSLSSILLAASTIEIVRTTALSQVKPGLRSKSTTCLNSLENEPFHLDKSSGRSRRKSNELKVPSPKPLQQHKRSNSSVCLIRQDNIEVFEPKNSSEDTSSLKEEPFVRQIKDEVPSRGSKANTFPRLMPGSPTFPMKKLKKSLSLVTSQVKHASNMFNPPFLQSGQKTTKLPIKRAKSEVASKPSDKIGRSLSKLKSEVLGKSVEGIVDPSSTDCAFEITEIYEDPNDLTIVPQISGNGNEFRDLSAWRLSIPKLATSSSNANGKPFFVFIIEVQRLDIKSNLDDGSDLRFKVCRKYNEFYALEAKLTEFHGEFEDAKLPPKAKFAAWKGLDVLQSKRESFENYLTSLLLKPALKESDILYTFLTSDEEFTTEGSNLGLGKMIKNVPIKLTKERGQSLQHFIDSFVMQIQSPPAKPKYESVMGPVQDHDGTTERQVDHHYLFKNNFNANKVSNPSREMASFVRSHASVTSLGVYDTVLYLLATVFRVSRLTLGFLVGIGLVIRQTFDCYVGYIIDCKLTQVLNTMRIVHLCRLLEGALFEPHEPHSETDLIVRRETALRNFQNYIRPVLNCVTGPVKYEEGTQIIFEALQDPITNKHLALVLLDVVVAEVFPELRL